MENRCNHREAGTGVQRSGFGPENELNPMRSYQADIEEPFRTLSATVGGRAAAIAGGAAAKPTPLK